MSMMQRIADVRIERLAARQGMWEWIKARSKAIGIAAIAALGLTAYLVFSDDEDEDDDAPGFSRDKKGKGMRRGGRRG